jgi:uncharacterized membrane protein (DUF485 family)
MSDFAECLHCGTLFHLGKGAGKIFECQNCKKVVKVSAAPNKVVHPKKKNQDVEKYRQFQEKLSRIIFLLGSTVGIFVLLIMIPSIIYVENQALLAFLLIMELVFGTLLVCSSVSFYLLSSQVYSLTALMTFHQHNLTIFHDQISRLFTMFKRRD